MIYQDMYKQLIEEAENYGITVIEKNFLSEASGLCKGRKIAINANISSYEDKARILAEEIAHCLFTVGDILDTRKALNRLQEEIARAIAAQRMKGKPFPVHIAPPGSYGYYINKQRKQVKNSVFSYLYIKSTAGAAAEDAGKQRAAL